MSSTAMYLTARSLAKACTREESERNSIMKKKGEFRGHSENPGTLNAWLVLKNAEISELHVCCLLEPTRRLCGRG